MGESQSRDKSPVKDAFTFHCEHVYLNLNSKSGSRCNFKDNFVSLFGGPAKQFGLLLYDYILNCQSGDKEVNSSRFLLAMTKLRAIAIHNTKDTSEFFLSLFSNHATDLKSALQLLLHAAVSCALLAGSTSDLVISTDYPLLTSMSLSIMEHVTANKDDAEGVSFHHWLSINSPHMLTGLRQWLLALISPSYERQYHLPVIQCEREREVELHVLMWTLSGVISTKFLGAIHSGATDKGLKGTHEELPQGGSWTCLYSSRKHGLSMNRFQHHCFDYKQPSVLILECQAKESTHCYALAMDSEWRDGTYFYGGEDFSCIQLQPTYSIIKRGAKLVSLNEKQRGFPTGLRVMASQRYDYSLLEVKPSLEEARSGEGEWMQVQLVEVWGCGGMDAQQSQRRIKEWEAKQVLRQREVNRSTLATTWQNNPDRLLLEMAGITTSTPQENL